MVWYRFFAAHARARFGDNERGASLVEYALLVALIAIVCIGVLGALGRTVRSRFGQIGDSIANDR